MKHLEEFCDVTLVSCDGEKIRAHKVVLASASTIFRDMLQTEEEDVEYQVINMKEVNTKFMLAMIDLVYKGEAKVENRECEEFLIILKEYNILKVKSNKETKKI